MPEFKLFNLFPLTIYKSKIILTDSDKKDLENEIFDMEKKSQNLGYKVENKAWTGDTQGYENLHNNIKFKKLFGEIENHIKKYLELLNIDLEKIDIFFQRAWSTISKGVENISPHIHSQSHISFAYYLKKNSTDANIVFLDEKQTNEIIPRLFTSESVNEKKIIKKRDQLNSPAATFVVNEGDIVIFPSKTLHSTQANVKNDYRISLSADVSILSKESEYLEHLVPPFEKWKKFSN